MATDPQFTTVPVIGMVQISTANAARDGTGTLGTVVTGGANGTKISRVIIEATGITTAGMVRLFIVDNAANKRLLQEQTIAAVTPNATVKAEHYELSFVDLVLPASWSLAAATEKAETFNVIALGGNF